LGHLRKRSSGAQLHEDSGAPLEGRTQAGAPLKPRADLTGETLGSTLGFGDQRAIEYAQQQHTGSRTGWTVCRYRRTQGPDSCGEP
jgi:hypothetical protein